MNYEIKIDSDYTDPKVLILTAQLTQEVNELLGRLQENSPKILTGTRDDRLEILSEREIIRVLAQEGKVLAYTDQGCYTLRLRLYEAEDRLNKKTFVRISNSEIVNLRKIKNFDFSITGTICIRLTDGTTSYVSRRYVQKIKKILGV